MSKLLDDAKAAGFNTDGERVTIFGKQYSSVHNSDITEELAKFAALQIPDGYKLVPIEPTLEMLEAAFADEITLSEAYTTYGIQFHIWEAMLDASPPTNTEDI